MAETREALQTVAEASGYRRTSLHREVVEFLERLAVGNDRLSLLSMGRSARGQGIPVAVLSAGRLFTPERARASGLPIVLVIANIHAGEVEGKEASLALARDVTTGVLSRLCERAVVLLLPDYNPDGNDRIDPQNRRLDLKALEGQIGPEEGVGTRTTAEGINLNRDYVKQAAVESRHLAALMAAWRPHVVVDCHTTDGSVHGYDLTFDTSRNVASCPPGPALYARDTLLRAVSRSLLARTGRRTWFYGNFRDQDDPTSGWETYPPQPRYGSHYRGLLGCVDVLLETYSYIDYRARCETIYETLVELLDYVGAHGSEIVALVRTAEIDTVARGRTCLSTDRVGVSYLSSVRDGDGPLSFRCDAQPLEDVDIEAWDLESQRARRIPGRERRTYRNTYYGRFEPTVWVNRPYAYVLWSTCAEAIERLRGHDVDVRTLGRALLDADAYRVDAIETAGSRDIATGAVPETVLSVTPAPGSMVKSEAGGMVVVFTAQPRGDLAIHLLEPEADDGLARWGFFDGHLRVGSLFPVFRIPAAIDLPLV